MMLQTSRVLKSKEEAIEWLEDHTKDLLKIIENDDDCLPEILNKILDFNSASFPCYFEVYRGRDIKEDNLIKCITIEKLEEDLAKLRRNE